MPYAEQLIELVKVIGGPAAALMAVLFVWERVEHGKTRKALHASLEKRIEDNGELKRVIEASTIRAELRTDADKEMSAAFRQLSNLVMIRFGAPLTMLTPERPE